MKVNDIDIDANDRKDAEKMVEIGDPIVIDSGYAEIANGLAVGRAFDVRAAEFLGLTGAADPRPVIMDVLRQTTDPIEATLTLNSAALLETSKPGYDFDLSEFESAAWVAEKGSLAKYRIEYLDQ